MRMRRIRNRRKDASICLLLPLALVYYVLVFLNHESSSTSQERITAKIHLHTNSNNKIAHISQYVKSRHEPETRVRSTDNTSPDEIEKPSDTSTKEKVGEQDANADQDETKAQTRIPSSLDMDKRLELPRPFMETVSESFFSSIKDIEQHFQPDERCSKWGGVKYIERYKASSTSILKPGKSKLEYYKLQGSNKEIFYAENVTIITRGKNVAPRLYLNGEYINEDAKYKFTDVDQNTVLGEMTMSIQTTDDMTCNDEEYTNDPILLVDSPIDTNNWWFLLKTMLHNFIAVTILQPKLYGDYKNSSIRVLHTMHDGSYVKSFTDAFDFFFSNQRARDSRQIWDAKDIGTLLSQNDNDNGEQRKICFRKVAWTLGADTLASDILVNQQHQYDECFSSIIYAYAAHLKATLSIPTLPRPKKPRVVWVARDTSDEANPTSWQQQRIIHNQEHVIDFLRSKCKEMEIEFIVADFYANKAKTTYQEQATFVSKANVMIGMHGAGLNMFHFMPFGSNIVEIHRGTNANMNSRNFVKQTGVGTYYTIDASIDGDRNLDPEPVWNVLKDAILNWQEGTNAIKR